MLYFWFPTPAEQSRRARILIAGYILIAVGWLVEIGALCTPEWIVGSKNYGILPYPDEYSNWPWAIAGCWLMYIASANCFFIFFIYIGLVRSVKIHGWGSRLRKFYYAISLFCAINGVLIFTSFMIFAINESKLDYRIGYSGYLGLVSALCYVIASSVFVVFNRNI